MKMKYSAWVLNFLLIFGLCTMTTLEVGCTSQQFANVVSQIQAQLPIVQADAVAISQFAAPQFVPLINLVGTTVSTDLPLLTAAISDWQDNPNATTQQKIEAIVDDLVTKVDAQLLAANGLSNSQDKQAFVLSLGMLASVLHLIDGFIIQTQSAKQAQAHAATHSAKLEQLLPLLDQKVLADGARHAGTTIDASVRYEKALGF